MATSRSTRRRPSLAPRKEKRGLDAAEIALAPDAPEVAALKPPMPIAEALTRMAAAAKRFDAKTVKSDDLALVAALAPEG